MNKSIIPVDEKIAVGLPRGADTTFHYEFIKSLFEMFGSSPCNYNLISASKVHHVARNTIMQNFLDSGMNYLLFIDSDMIWEADSLARAYKLIQHPQVDIVTGIYFTKNKPHLPVLKRLDMRAGCYNIITKWGNEPFEVDGAGMGFMLIPRYVIEKMKTPYCDWVGGFSEDLYFCLKAKKDHGFKIWADPQIRLGHVTKTTITSMDWMKNHIPSIDAWVREAMVGTTKVLKRDYPNWREDLGISSLNFKNINTEEHWDKTYKLEGGKATWRNYPEKNKIVVEKIKEIKGNKKILDVLELGCGVGIFASKLVKEVEGIDYSGIDISGFAVEECKKEGLLAKKMKVPPIKQPKNFYDLVVGLELLEHLDEKPRLEVLEEVKRILKTNGIAIFSVPNNNMPPDDVPEHRVVYNKESFYKFLKQIFNKVEVDIISSRHSDKVNYKTEYLLAVCKNEVKNYSKKGKKNVASIQK
jgi:2-polyprenyl-3-methyl-5-hydroxy-6-metoxy-1,4-benzoquinol methylase